MPEAPGCASPARLTIAIPTFDRHEYLVRTLRGLIPQLTPECRLIVVDNVSQPRVIDTVRALLDEFEVPAVQVVRNRVNIGANANILRCMELCETEWLWIVSDDDRICGDAVGKILKGTHDHPTCVCLNFAQTLYPRSEASTTQGRTEFLEVIGKHFPSLLFLSTSVYRTGAVLPHLIHGYVQIPSCAPHMAVLIMAIKGIEAVHFAEETIVEYVPARKGSGWSRFWVEHGLPLLLDLPLGSHDRDLLRKALRSRLGLATIVATYVDVLCYGTRSGDLAVCAPLYKMAALRRASLGCSTPESLLTLWLRTTLFAPGLALWLLRIFFRTVRGQALDVRASSVGAGPEERV